MIEFGVTVLVVTLAIIIALLVRSVFGQKRAEEELRQYRDRLEAMVQARTAELEQANKQLQTEIAEREHAEATLAQERMLLRTVINNLPDSIYVKDHDGRFILDNLAHARIIGLNSPEELIGRAELELSPQTLSAAHQAEDLAIIQSGQPVFQQEDWLINPDGKKQWLLNTKIPLRDTHGAIIGLVGISRNITERKLAEESYQQHTRELNLLNHMGNLLQACKTEDDAYSIMGSVCKLLFPSDTGYLSVMNPSRTELNVVLSWGDPEPDTTVFSVNDCWACRLDTTHYLEHPESGLLCAHLDVFPEHGYVCALVSSIDEVLGIFHLRFGAFDASSPEDERKRVKKARRMMVNRVVRHLALFIVNLRLRETLKREAIRDPLTGLYNRRHMEASLDREARRAERLHTPVGLLLIDVDHFKRFNDTYGHEVGDLVLHTLGDTFKSNIRGEDIACRYGGEEFLLILPDTSPEHSKTRAEEIRQKVKMLRIPYQHEELTITISIGVAVLPYHGPGLEEALKAADNALYQAKADGRDRVVLASF